MSHARPARRRLAATATVVLAATIGATVVALPAAAAPPVRGAAQQAVSADAAAVAFPVGHKIVAVTASGYLTWDNTKGDRAWVRASDGAVTDLVDSLPMQATGYGDLVAVLPRRDTAELRDLATGRKVFDVFAQPAAGLDYAGAAGRALFITDRSAPAGAGLLMHTKDGGRVPVTGLPADATLRRVSAGTSAHGLVTYTSGDKKYWGLIDLATGAVTETGLRDESRGNGDIAVSPEYVAWVEYRSEGPVIVVRTRATGETRRIALVAGATARDIEVGLQGDHLVYGDPGGLTATNKSSMHPLTAHDLKTGADTRLLDHLTSAATSPDGVLHVRGGTVADGEGLFRVSPGADGTPAATMVASTGEPTALALVGHDVPAMIDLDRDRGRIKLRWTLSRNNAELWVTLRHKRTGKIAQQVFYGPEPTDFTFEWRGDVDQVTASAPNGDYAWEISARPRNGIGPTLTSSGAFEVVREAAPHDYTDNGSPDLLARDPSGRLWRTDSHFDSWNDNVTRAPERKLVGGGWNTYDRIEAAGNLGGAAHGDLVARDKAGVLWLYLSKGDGTFATRSRIGGGWGVYDEVAAGSDLTNDGRADLLATDKSGVLWLYKGTGDWRAPFGKRTRVGGGWGVYNELTATGDIGGAATGDLVARDKAGVLWLYLGKGDGTFAPRTRIGGGWNAYRYTVGIGDADRDGRPDLYAYGADETYYYPGTGNWRAPFGARKAVTILDTYPDHTAVS
ncbi:FG-GAP repeat domain-containing protein [Streptomyces sp. NPDC057781]|uniref:FG-GAP repeat domain-containing protein n=1 Tax=unclassified Streptomyces TaxID=2593676 RepID=UPI0036B39EA5